jgi:pectin methylesterase-like acyl-CoA thioesterase
MSMQDPEDREAIESNNFLGFPINPKLVILLFFAFIAALAVIVGARAVASFNLDGGGNVIMVPGNYSTIQAAIDAAGSGDIIQVAPGVYSENVTINKPVSLVAKSFDPIDPVRNSTIIDGGGRATTITIPAGLPQMPVIHGFVIRNSGDGILAYSEFIAEYNYFVLANNLMSYQQGSGGINRNNVYFQAGNNAIQLDNMDRPLLIENNRIMYSTNDGIEISLQKPSAPFATALIDIRNNMIVGHGQDGIQLIQHPGEPQDTNRRFMIAGNLFANNKKAGLGFMPNADTTENYSGAVLGEAIRLFNNTFYGNDYGISGGGNLVTFNNIIANSITRGAWKVQGPAGSNAVVAFTLFHNNAVHAEQTNLGDGVLADVDPLFQAAPNPGPDGIWATIDDDFSGLVLRADSPAVDKGVAQYTAASGELVPPSPIVYSGAAPDLGWREVGAPIFVTPGPTLAASFTPLPTMTPVALTPVPTLTAVPPLPTTAIPSVTPPPTLTIIPSTATQTATLPPLTATITSTPALAIQSINPIGAQANTTVVITINGSGFQSGATVTFEGGQGLPQEVVTVQVMNSNTIMATINARNDGAVAQVWDVRVTNPNQSTAVLLDAFTVTPA